MASVAWVGVGAMVGGIARYYVGLLVARCLGMAFPYGTLLVNVSGCLLVGLLAGIALDRAAPVPLNLRLLLATGLLGGYTTFSSYGFETLNLIRNGSHLAAATNIVANNVLGLLAVWLAWGIGRMTH